MAQQMIRLNSQRVNSTKITQIGIIKNSKEMIVSKKINTKSTASITIRRTKTGTGAVVTAIPKIVITIKVQKRIIVC